MKYGMMPRVMWLLFHGSFERALETELHQEDGKEIMRKAYKHYKEILEDVDEFDSGDHFLVNILSCAMFSGVYLSLPKKPDVAAMTRYYSTAMDVPVMRPFVGRPGSHTQKKLDKLKRSAEFSQSVTNPYSWHFVIEDGATPTDYTATFSTCGICCLMKKLGIEEVTPAMCQYDYDMAQMSGTVFTRKFTLASGGPCCDCHYHHIQ